MCQLGPMRILLTAILACGVGTAGATTFDNVGPAGAETTTSTVAETTTTTSTTTTTLPDACDDDQDFGSTLCRLDALIAATEASDDLGGQKNKLVTAATKARSLIRSARDKCDAAGPQAEKKSGRDLRKASRKLIGYKRGLTSNHARKSLDDDVRASFLDLFGSLQDDVKALKGCPPDDGSPSGAFLDGR